MIVVVLPDVIIGMQYAPELMRTVGLSGFSRVSVYGLAHRLSSYEKDLIWTNYNCS